MKQIIPISKELKFNTTVYEICSISLEHELNQKEVELLGDFVVSGEFKSHELSVNKEKFLFRVPFSVDLSDNILKDTLKLEIIDFNYELKENNLKVDIEFEIEAEEKEEPHTILDDVDFKEIDDLFKEEETEDRSREDVEETIMDSIIEDDENIVYKVHIIRENETIESVCLKYNTTVDDLKTINDLSDIKNGDKIIIPYSNE